MIKAIIFDLNGVFIQSPLLSDRFKDDFCIKPEIFLSALKEIMAHVRMPDAPEVYDLFVPYLGKWNVKLSRDQFYNYWFGAEKQNKKMINYAQKLKEKGLLLFVLSNNLRERSDYYSAHFPFVEKLFDKAYYSWKTGFIKPDLKAFEQVLKEYNLKAEECLYFDDSEKNVDAAKSIDINAHTFTTPEGVMAIIERNC